MTDEEYERIKKEIGWHMTGWDVAFFAAVVVVAWVLVALS